MNTATNTNIEQPSDIFPLLTQKLLDKHGKPIDLSLNFLPELNKKIWGLQKKNLVVVAGRPSNGKSALMLNMAIDFAIQGKKVVFFTLEMTLETCLLRMMNNYCEIDNWINLAGMSVAEYEKFKPKLTEFQNKLEDMNFLLVESFGKTFDEIFRTIESLGVDVDAVFIDYIQMIKATSQTDKQALDEYIKKLREYAIKKNFCAIIGSQINRDTHAQGRIKPPELHQLKGTGVLEEVLDVCFLLHWPYHYSEDAHKNDYWIKVAKNRDGRTGGVNCIFYPEYSQIKEKPNDKPEGFSESQEVSPKFDSIEKGVSCYN